MGFSDIIGQAIAFEVEAYEFYDKAIEIVSSEQAKTILRELRAEEKGHKAKLEQVLAKGPSWAIPMGKREETVDLKLGEFALTRTFKGHAADKKSGMKGKGARK